MSDMLRITGMASGLDVDSIVKKLMAAENTKMDKLKQARTKEEWKQEAYRDIITDIANLRDTYFNTLKSDTNMLSANNFACYGTSNVDSSTASIATATAGSGAKVGTYSLSNIKKAITAAIDKSAAIQTIREANSNITFPVNSSDIPNTMTFNLNGKDYTITLDTSSNYTSLSSMASDINSKLKTAQGESEKEDVSSMMTASLSSDGTSISFKATDSNVLSTISKSDSTSVINGTNLDFSINIKKGVNDALTISVNGVAKSISLLDDGFDSQQFTSLNALVTRINDKLDAAGIGPGSGSAAHDVQAQLSLDGTRIQFKNMDTTNQLILKGTAAGALGFSSSSTGSDIGPAIYSRMSSLFTDNTDANTSFKINGVDFTYDFSSTGKDKDRSINDIIKEISTKANCNITYSELQKKFTIESKTTGGDQTLSLSEDKGNFLDALFGADSSDEFNATVKTFTGSDAQVTIKDPTCSASDAGTTIYRSTNSFTIDGMTYNILDDDTTTNVDIKVTSDVQKSVDKFKAFIDKYNDLVSKINTKITEKTNKDYAPLTDEQKSSMTEEQIEKWETKAKAGILQNDSNLQSMLYKLRETFFDQIGTTGVDKLNVSMTDMGLATSSTLDYSNGGKVVIADETKLKSFIQNNPSDFTDFFTRNSTTSYDPNHLTDKGRYQSEGVMDRIKDIIDDYTRTTRDSNGYKGTLLRIAGMKGDASEYNNDITKDLTNNYDKRIKELTTKLNNKETYYYNQFSKLEEAMTKLNSQQSWLTQQFSS